MRREKRNAAQIKSINRNDKLTTKEKYKARNETGTREARNDAKGGGKNENHERAKTLIKIKTISGGQPKCNDWLNPPRNPRTKGARGRGRG